MLHFKSFARNFSTISPEVSLGLLPGFASEHIIGILSETYLEIYSRISPAPCL